MVNHPGDVAHRSLRALLRGSLGLAAGWAFTLMFCTLVVSLNVVTLRLLARTMVAPAAHFWARTLLAMSGVRVVFENRSTLADRRARVIVINHPSTLDFVWGGLILPPGGLVIAKREIVYLPAINLAWWALRFERIDRSDAAAARRTLARLAQRVRAERLSLLMAPEGTRSRDGSFQPFKKGAFHLAMQAGIPICPLVATGAYEIWPRHRWLPVPGVLRIRFLQPVETGAWTTDSLNAHIDAVRASMLEALSAMESGSSSA